MKIIRIYFVVAVLCMILTAAIGGIKEAESNTRRVAFGDEDNLFLIQGTLVNYDVVVSLRP